ncbi:hypothetical protein THAOC_03765, partial [Thalassiosira oceanica]
QRATGLGSKVARSRLEHWLWFYVVSRKGHTATNKSRRAMSGAQNSTSIYWQQKNTMNTDATSSFIAAPLTGPLCHNWLTFSRVGQEGRHGGGQIEYPDTWGYSMVKASGRTSETAADGRALAEAEFYFFPPHPPWDSFEITGLSRMSNMDPTLQEMWKDPERQSRSLLLQFLSSARKSPPVQECLVWGLLRGEFRGPDSGDPEGEESHLLLKTKDLMRNDAPTLRNPVVTSQGHHDAHNHTAGVAGRAVGEGSGHGPGQPVKDCQEPSISTRAARDEASYPTC